MRGIEASGQDRHIHQIAKTLGFELFNQHVAFGARRVSGDKCGVVSRQQTQNFFGVFNCGGENHHPFTRLGKLDNLADDMRRYSLLLFQFLIQVRFAKQAVTLRLQAAEVILHYRHVEAFWRRQVAVFNHVAQR